jgi:hypothetical protein
MIGNLQHMTGEQLLLMRILGEGPAVAIIDRELDLRALTGPPEARRRRGRHRAVAQPRGPVAA